MAVKDQTSGNTPKYLCNQYGFKLTGSAMTAMINITRSVTILLERNKYVYCLLVDFSKMFDSIDHLVLVKKFKRMTILFTI